MSNKSNWLAFIKSGYFLKNLGMILGTFLLFFFLANFFLKRFTHHGEAIEMPDWVGEYVETIEDRASKHRFKLQVVDSIFIVGKTGGEIISQNPSPGSKVKSRRTVYLTVTKNKADEISSSRLPVLYGKSYERKSRELKNGYELFTSIAGYKYDPGPENYILAVLYDGDTIVSAHDRKMDIMIEKGSTLSFILSKSTGGEVDIPNMVCKTYAEALFLARTINIRLTEESSGELTDRYNAYVASQEPSFFPGGRMLMGDTLHLILQREQPGFCLLNDDE